MEHRTKLYVSVFHDLCAVPDLGEMNVDRPMSDWMTDLLSCHQTAFFYTSSAIQNII